jgi:hypothetical protein
MKKRKIYIIPGLGETTKMDNYKDIITFAKENNFKVVPIKVVWSMNKDITDFIKEIDAQIPNDSKNDYVLGFSIGAYILSILSKKKKIGGYIFCTISPFFKENLNKIPKDTKEYFGEKMMKSFSKYSFPKNNKDRAWFLVGDKDWKLAIDTAKIIYKNWKGQKDLIMVKDAGHQLNHKNYLIEVKKIIKIIFCGE